MRVLHPRHAVTCGAQRSCRAILTASYAVKIRPCHGTHHREARQGLYQKIPGSQMTTRRALRRQRPCCPQSAWPAAALPNLPAGRRGITIQCGEPQPRAVMSTTKPGISTGHRHLIATTRNMQRAGTMWPGGSCLMTKQLLSPSSPESRIAVSLRLSML